MTQSLLPIRSPTMATAIPLRLEVIRVERVPMKFWIWLGTFGNGWQTGMTHLITAIHPRTTQKDRRDLRRILRGTYCAVDHGSRRTRRSSTLQIAMDWNHPALVKASASVVHARAARIDFQTTRSDWYAESL